MKSLLFVNNIISILCSDNYKYEIEFHLLLYIFLTIRNKNRIRQRNLEASSLYYFANSIISIAFS